MNGDKRFCELLLEGTCTIVSSFPTLSFFYAVLPDLGSAVSLPKMC